MINRNMNKQESVKKNYVYNTFYQVLTFLTPLVTAPYVSRILGADGVGVYSYTNSVATYFVLLASLGTVSYGQREISMHRDSQEECSKLFWEIEILSIVTTAISLGLWIILIFISDEYTCYYLLLTLNLISVAFDISWFFGGFEKFKYIVIRNTIVKIVGIILLFGFVKDKDDTLVYVGIIAITGLLGNISMWAYLPKMIVKIDVKNIHPFKIHLKQSFAYFVPAIATSVYTVLDKTMIGVITKSEDENGYYEQATKIIRLVQSLLFSLNTVMSARQSYLFNIGKFDEMKDKIVKSFDYLFSISIPIMFSIVAISNNFVPLFFGDGYNLVIKILCAMSPLPFVISISNILGNQYLTPIGQRVRSIKAIIAGAATNVVLNSFLIPKFGAIGAAIASVIAEFVISLIYIHMSKTVVKVVLLLKIAAKKFGASILMFIAIIFIGRAFSNKLLALVLQITLGAFFYGLLLFAFRDSFAKESLRYLKSKIYRKEKING